MKVSVLTNIHLSRSLPTPLPCLPSRGALAVALGNALDLVLLLDGIGVGRTLGGVHDLVSKALGNRLDVAEGRLARARRDQVDGLVDAAQRRDVARLAAHGTAATHAGRVLP